MRDRIEVSPGTHRHRVHEALDQARRQARRQAPRDDTPTGGDVAARWLSGVAGFADRDGARILALLGDASRRVRGVAMRVAPLACNDDQATEALRIAWSLRGERRLLRRMARRERTAAIDAFLDGLAAASKLRDLIDDLPFGSEACVRRHLGHALERPSHRFWHGLAHGHPALLAELLVARWRGVTGEADPVTRELVRRYHLRIAERAPAAGLELAELLLARRIDPTEPVWTELLRRLPDAAVDLAIRHAARVPAGAFERRLRDLDPALLARIMGHAPGLLGGFGPRVRRLSADRRRALADAWLAASERFPVHGAYLLRHLPAGPARDRAHERWSLAARDRDGIIAAELIAALPVELAAREAARHLGEVTALATDPARRIRGIARHLPWAALEAALRALLGHPEGALRATALGELLANPGVYPDDAALPARALEQVLARKFEQDPVRQGMIGALAVWPRRVWQPAHLPAVERVVRDALDAADLSTPTAAAAQRLIVRLFGVDPGWAARQLAITIQERGALYDPNLGAKLSDDDLRTAALELVAIARTWAAQERTPWLIHFARGLGRRLPLVAGLSAVVSGARDAAPHEHHARELTEVLARHDPAHHAATLPAALARYRDRRWVDAILAAAQIDGLVGNAAPRVRDRRRPPLSPAVCEAVVEIALSLDARHAPAALAMLRRRAPATFDRLVAEVIAADESVVFLPDIYTWVSRHRQDLLDRYLEDRTIRGRWATGHARWILPFDDGFFRWRPAQVERYAASLERIVGDPARDTPAVFAALTRWPRMEYATMDRLCALAGDERPAVREKAIRVLARCDAGQGVPTLLACLGDDRARFAIYGLRRALFGMAPDRAIALLADAPMRKVTVAKEVVRLTGELRAAGACARLLELAAGPLHRDVRIALLRALWDHLDRDETWALFERAVDDPDWVLASRLADIPADRLTAALDDRLARLLARLVARPEPEARIGMLQRASALTLVDRTRVLLAAIRGRLRSIHDDEVHAAMIAVMVRSTEDDMAALGEALDDLRGDPRAFHVAAAALTGCNIRSRASWRRAATELEAVALRDRRWAVVAIQAAAARVQPAELVATIERGPLDVDAIAAARIAIERLDDDQLAGAVAALVGGDRPEVRRVAVFALAHDARPGRGWTELRLAQLARLRRDPSPEVAGAAARLWPPREHDPGW